MSKAGWKLAPLAASIALAALALQAPARLSAQVLKGSKGSTWMIGPWVGLNFATFGGSDASGAGTHTGLTAGGQIQRALSPDLFVRLGALYSMRGEEESGVAVKLNYIEFPLVLGYQFPLQGSQVKPYVFGGGQFGFKASCSISGGGNSVDCDTFFQSVGASASVASTDIGITGGAGVGFPLGRGHVMVDARYYLGFTKLISSGGTSADLKNQGFTIAAGYMIPFGH
jgi:opacity protein-like surface antigen